MICNIEDCNKDGIARSLCSKHYTRWRKTGDPNKTNRHVEVHGMSRSKEYRSWANMIDRCYNPNRVNYPRYGGRGIRVCARWRHSFLNFYKDMGKRPDNMSLDREDNDKGYSPDNCRWTDVLTQARNKKQKSNPTGYKGVFANVRGGKFASRIMIEGNFFYIGSFLTKEEAAHAYDCFAVALESKTELNFG